MKNHLSRYFKIFSFWQKKIFMGINLGMYPISFTAKYKDKVYISYCNKNNEIRDKEVTMVELDKSSQTDRDAVFKTACLWQINDGIRNYSWNILTAMEREKDPDVCEEHFLALTTQKDNFENLNYKKMLGIVMVSENEDESAMIDWLQVKPIYTYADYRGRRKYSNIGKAMRNYIQHSYPFVPIYVYPALGVEDFYLKSGFVPDSVDSHMFRYEC